MTGILLLFTLVLAACCLANPVKVNSGGSDSIKLAFGDSIIYEIPPFAVEWDQAKYNCKWLGMELARIETQEEQIALQEALVNYDSALWVSLNDKYSDFTFIWESTGDTAENFENWGPSEPLPYNAYACVNLGAPSTNRTWFTELCNKELRYIICEKPTCASGKNSDGAVAFSFGNGTYEVPAFRANWNEANYNCKLQGMQLVTIETREKQLEIQEALENIDTTLWVSLNDRYKNFTFIWESSGKTIESYQNWAENNPYPLNDHECVILGVPGTNREWFSSQCSFERRYICEKPVSPCS